jgi:predicted dehydrogenase
MQQSPCRLAFVPVVSEPKHLFNDPNIDLIVIPTPNDTHFPLAKAALEAGKHVVVDKPFTVTLSQARELDALAKSLGRLLSVFHNRRWDSDFLTVKSLLSEGALGEILFESHFDRFRPQVRNRWREQAVRAAVSGTI